jgi:hypothetical protein
MLGTNIGKGIFSVGDSFGIALYHISEPMTTRATFNATANNCDAYPGHCNASVTPWLSLGCGYRRTIDKRNAGDGLSAVRRTRGLFWSHVRMKTIDLPRQALDKHSHESMSS